MSNHAEPHTDQKAGFAERAESPEQIDPNDRQAIASRLMEFAPLIRRRLQYRLTGQDRRLFDTQDLLSTILRRVDAMVAKGKLRASTDRELISLVLTILDNALVDRHRLLTRLKRVEAQDGVWASWLRTNIDLDNSNQAADTLSDIFDSIESAEDRLLLSLRLSGASHAMIAEIIDTTADACRQRWVSLKNRISSGYPERLADVQ